MLSPATDLLGTIRAAPTVTLLVTNTTGSDAPLSGWIDYNQNGVFDNATERTQATIPNGSKDIRVNLTFPAIPSGSTGKTYARFRLSTDAAGQNPIGAATDGEVEDYSFAITAPTSGTVDSALSPKIADGSGGLLQDTLANTDQFGFSVANLGDLDGDGVDDLAVGANGDDTGGGASSSCGAVHVLFLEASGFTLSKTAATVSEDGTTTTFTVVLDSEPTAEFTITLTSSNTAEGTVSPLLLAFTPADFDQQQTVTVTGVDDTMIDGDIEFQITTVAAGGNYDGLTAADVNVTNEDNDREGILDVDGNAVADALSDGIVILRFAAGFTGNALTDGAVDSANGSRTDPDSVLAFLQSPGDQLDIDGNGEVQALSDGILIIRFLAGFRGDSLITGVVDTANGTRVMAVDIETYLATLIPATPPLSVRTRRLACFERQSGTGYASVVFWRSDADFRKHWQSQRHPAALSRETAECPACADWGSRMDAAGGVPVNEPAGTTMVLGNLAICSLTSAADTSLDQQGCCTVSRTWMVTVLFLATPVMVVGQESHTISPAVARRDSNTFDVPPVLSGEAAPVRFLTLAELEGMAFRNNPTLVTAAARMNVARGKQVQAGLCPNPVAGYHATEIGNRGTAGQQGAFISQRFITGGKLQLDQAIAGKEIDEAHFRIHAQEQRVLSDVRVRFYDALVAQRRVALTTELARIGDNFVRATEQLIENRQGTENDLLQAEIRADESHILFDNAVNERIESWRRLVTVVGVPWMEASPLNGRLDADQPDFDWDMCCASVLANNPTLAAARTRAERSRIVIRRAKKEPIPNIDLFVSVRHHNITDNDVANVQLGIPVPVFDRNQGNIRSAEAEWVAACNEVKRIELSLQDRLAVAWRQYANACQQTDRYRERMVPRARRSLSLVTDAYQKGQVEYLTLLTAQDTYLRVNLSYLDALRELRSSSSIIEGRLLTDSLAERN